MAFQQCSDADRVAEVTADEDHLRLAGVVDGLEVALRHDDLARAMEVVDVRSGQRVLSSHDHRRADAP